MHGCSHFVSYSQLCTLTDKKRCSSCSHTSYEMKYFSGCGHGIVGLHHMQNVSWNLTIAKKKLSLAIIKRIQLLYDTASQLYSQLAIQLASQLHLYIALAIAIYIAVATHVLLLIHFTQQLQSTDKIYWLTFIYNQHADFTFTNWVTQLQVFVQSG